MRDALSPPHLAPETRRRCQLAWALLLVSVLSWGESSSPFALSTALEQAATIFATAVAFVLAVQANPTLSVARVPSLLLACLLAAASTIPGALGMAPLNSLILSARFGLIVGTIALLSPIVVADPTALLRTHLLVHGMITGCLMAGAILAPGLAFHPGTRRLAGLLPPMHPSQVGAVAVVTLGLAVLGLLAGVIGRRVGAVTVVVAAMVLVQSRSRTAILAAVLGLLIAIGSMAFRSQRARKLLVLLVCLAATAWLVAAPAIVDWFARGQTHAQIQSASGRRGTWIAMLEERPTGVNHWFGIGLGDKRYKGKPIDGGWIAAYWGQGLVGLGIVAMVVLIVALSLMHGRDDLLRAAGLFLVVFVIMSANAETGISDISLYFLSLMLAGLLAVARPPTLSEGTPNAYRRRSQPLPH